jgi:hypothetical protein
MKLIQAILNHLHFGKGFTTIILKEDGPLSRPGEGHYKAGTYAIIPIK